MTLNHYIEIKKKKKNQLVKNGHAKRLAIKEMVLGFEKEGQRRESSSDQDLILGLCVCVGDLGLWVGGWH